MMKSTQIACRRGEKTKLFMRELHPQPLNKTNTDWVPHLLVMKRGTREILTLGGEGWRSKREKKKLQPWGARVSSEHTRGMTTMALGYCVKEQKKDGVGRASRRRRKVMAMFQIERQKEYAWRERCLKRRHLTVMVEELIRQWWLRSLALTTLRHLRAVATSEA